MSQIDYLIPLVSIIVGLGLADLIQSFRNLLRPNRAVRWHWLPVLWATVVFLLVLRIWWTAYDVLQQDAFGRVLVFLPYLLNVLGLYLACSFALPDPDWTPGPDTAESGAEQESGRSAAPLDLEAFYFSAVHRRWFFGTLIAIVVLFEAITVLFFLTVKDTSLLTIVVGRWEAVTIVPAALVVLIFTDRCWVHAAFSVVAFVGAVLNLAGAAPIGG
jgi:hypothetical protein